MQAQMQAQQQAQMQAQQQAQMQAQQQAYTQQAQQQTVPQQPQGDQGYTQPPHGHQNQPSAGVSPEAPPPPPVPSAPDQQVYHEPPQASPPPPQSQPQPQPQQQQQPQMVAGSPIEQWNAAAELHNATQSPPMGTRHTVQGARPVYGHAEGRMQEVRDADGNVFHVPDPTDAGQGVQAQPRYGADWGTERAYAPQGDRQVSGQMPFGRGYTDMADVPTAENVNNQFGGGHFKQ